MEVRIVQNDGMRIKEPTQNGYIITGRVENIERNGRHLIRTVSSTLLCEQYQQSNILRRRVFKGH